MKKHFSLFLMLAAIVAMPAGAATNWGATAGSTADLTGAPAVRANPANVNYEKYETRSTTRTYSNAGGQNVGTVQYTAQPTTRAQMYTRFFDNRFTHRFPKFTTSIGLSNIQLIIIQIVNLLDVIASDIFINSFTIIAP